ncbi:MAG: hypothetical protein ACREAK_07025 [Nitrosarchaeum sp.]
MNSQEQQSAKKEKDTSEIVVYQCNCDEIKKIRVVYDGGFGEKFTVEYCQKCYEQEDKKFVDSMEKIE